MHSPPPYEEQQTHEQPAQYEEQQLSEQPSPASQKSHHCCEEH